MENKCSTIKQSYKEIPFPTDIKLRIANNEWAEANLHQVFFFLI